MIFTWFSDIGLVKYLGGCV